MNNLYKFSLPLHKICGGSAIWNTFHCVRLALSVHCHTNSMAYIKSEAVRLRPVSKCGNLTVSRDGRRKAVYLDGRTFTPGIRKDDAGNVPFKVWADFIFLLTGTFHNLLTEDV